MDQLGCPELDDVDPASITAEHLLYAEDRVKYRKQLLRDEYESWLRRLAENWTRKKKRVADLMKSRSARKAERAAKNRAAREKIDLQLDKIEIDEFYRKLKLENHLRNKDAKLAANLANLKRTRLAEKRNRDVARYCKLYNNQKYRIENDMRALIRKCMRNAEGDEVSSTENAGAEVEHANFGDNSNTPEVSSRPGRGRYFADPSNVYGRETPPTFADGSRFVFVFPSIVHAITDERERYLTETVFFFFLFGTRQVTNRTNPRAMAL